MGFTNLKKQVKEIIDVKDENTTTPESVIHGFEKDNKLFVSDPGKFL